MKITKFMVLALAIASALTFAGCEEEEEKKAKCWFAFWNTSGYNLNGIKFGSAEMKPFPNGAVTNDLIRMECGSYFVELFNNDTQAYDVVSASKLPVPSKDHVYELQVESSTNGLFFVINDYGNINDLEIESVGLNSAMKKAGPKVIGSVVVPGAIAQHLIK